MIVVFRIDFGLIQTAARELRTKHYYVQGSVGIATGFLLAALHMRGLATPTHTPGPMGFLASILHRPKNERPFVLIPSAFQLRTRRFPISRRKVSTR
jgi:iodotyrosine deiodinase